MQNVELRGYPQDGKFTSQGVDELSDSDLQQVSGKGYDPAPDQRDMKRLGKRQELKVGFIRGDYASVRANKDLLPASIPFLLHRWLCHCVGSYLGILTGSWSILIGQRWCCWSDLADVRCVLGNGYGHVVYGRDGVYGADVRGYGSPSGHTT